MSRITLYIFLLLTTPLTLFAQKKEIAEAKTCLKTGKDLNKAESLMRSVIAMPEQKSPIDNYVLLTDIMRKQYEGVNELLYLHQLEDTTQMFSVLQRMFIAYQQLDSIDSQPDSKGNVRPRYRQRNAEYLNIFRPNLYKAGLFFMRKRDVAQTYSYFDSYLDCISHPLFTSMEYATKDSLRYDAAFHALTSAHRLKNYAGVRKHADLALQHPSRAHIVLSTLYNSYIEQGDTLKAVSYLHQGFNEHPEHHFFFPRLVDYYAAQNHLDSVVNIVNRACELEPGNMFYLLARNTIQLNMGEYDDCIALGDSLIHRNDKLSEAYMNVGASYFNKALQLDRRHIGRDYTLSQKRADVNAYYQKALPYIETYRSQRPRRQDRWAEMLYTIYLNLNMGDKFEEIDSLLKKHQ